jgi:hypothetical protein
MKREYAKIINVKKESLKMRELNGLIEDKNSSKPSIDKFTPQISIEINN